MDSQEIRIDFYGLLFIYSRSLHSFCIDSTSLCPPRSHTSLTKQLAIPVEPRTVNATATIIFSIEVIDLL